MACSVVSVAAGAKPLPVPLMSPIFVMTLTLSFAQRAMEAASP